MTTWLLILWLGGHAYVVDYDLTLDDCRAVAAHSDKHECREDVR